MTGTFLAISAFALLTVASSFAAYKWRRAQTIIEGEPLILIEQGKAIDRNLRAQRLNIDDLAEEARANGIESLDKVKWCVLESSGSMSFIKAS